MYHHTTATITLLVLALRRRANELRHAPDAGLTTAEYLMWIAIVVGVAVSVGVIVSSLFTTKANGLSLN